MSSVAFDLRSVKGFLVADARGRVVGRVESPMYGTGPDVPDALAVRSGFLRGRRLVPAEAIDELCHSELMRRALGLHIHERYVALKRKEWDEYRIQLTQWELDRYLKVL